MKIFALIRNELKKLFAKKSTIVVFLLAILLAFGIPYMDYYSRTQYSGNNGHYVENLEQEIQWTQQELDNVKNMLESGGEDYLYYDISWNESRIKALQLKLDSGLDTWDDWREEFTYELQNIYQEQFAIKPFLDGDKKLIKKYENSGLTGLIEQEALNYYYTEESTKKLRARNEELTQQITGFEEAYKNNDIDYVNKFYVNRQQGVIDGINDNIKELDKQRRELIKYNYKGMNDDAIKNVKEQIKRLEDSIPFEEELLKWKQYRFDHKITPGYSDWKSQSMNAIDEAVQLLNKEAMTKEEYDASGGQWNNSYTEKLTYDEYLIKFENSQIEAKDKITYHTYAIENDIAPLEYTYETRARIQSCIYFAVFAGAFVAILLGCAIVSREYSKGTIRLLLIRPVRRYKVLLSKVISVLLLAYIIFALFAVIITGTTVYFFGEEDFNTPVLAIENGEIVLTHIMDIVLPPLYMSAVTVLFIGAMAIMFSTIFKSTVLAVGVPLLLMLTSTGIAEILAQMEYYKAVIYTPFAYLNLYNIMNGEGYFIRVLKDAGITLDANFGFMLLLGSAAVMLLLTFIVFSKRDVKN